MTDGGRLSSTRACLFTSTAPRHAYIAQRIAAFANLTLVVREEKGLDTFYDQSPDRAVILEHLGHLRQTEEQFFGEGAWRAVEGEIVTVPRGGLNTPEIAALINRHRPDVAVVFGCGIIKAPVADVLPSGRTYNLHQGLSPYYRGSGTNFWPFVEERLGYIGVTVLALDPGVDTGGIIAHERPDIEPDDTLHRIGCKTVVKSADALQRIVRLSESGQVPAPFAQWETGRLFKRADMTAAAIHKARQLEQGGVVARYLADRQQGRGVPVRLIRLET